jgi:hypothetical protein
MNDSGQELSLEEITVIVAQNLDFAVMCADTARQVIEETGNSDSLVPGTTLEAVEEEIKRTLHFIQLAQRYLEQAKRTPAA